MFARNLEALELLDRDVVKQIIKQKFETVVGKSQYENDSLAKGEFELIKDLRLARKNAGEAKRKIDILIDKCGPAPRGVGIQNLRECIIETKWKYDVAPEDKQLGFKNMIINFNERYFYLICFCMYAIDQAPNSYKDSFETWIQTHKDLEEMCDKGKDKMEWSRQVDSAKLEKLKGMMLDPNYKANLPILIRTIYDFVFLTYADLPRGPIKNNSMRKLAASTLMEILPHELSRKVNEKINEDPKGCHDFLTIIGMISYY